MKNIANVLRTSKLRSLFILNLILYAKVEKKGEKTMDFIFFIYLCIHDDKIIDHIISNFWIYIMQ